MALYILFYYGAVLVYDLGIKDWYRFGFNEYDADGNPVGDLNVLKAFLRISKRKV